MNFKKHISIFLAFILLVSNVGFAIDVHYCGGEIASVKPVFWKEVASRNTIESDCCAPKKSSIVEKKGGCCKDKVLKFEKKPENTTVTSIAFQPHFVFLPKEWKPIIFVAFSSFKISKKRVEFESR